MPELTPEEKQRIYPEEKARLEAQEKLNPLAIKVRSVSIFSDTPSVRAYYAGKWD